jgi:hypothetical protein
MSAKQNANSLRRSMRLWHTRQQELTNYFNVMSARRSMNMGLQIARGEQAIRRKAVNIAARYGFQLNRGMSLNRIATRLITQLEMHHGGLPVNLVNSYTTRILILCL